MISAVAALLLSAATFAQAAQTAPAGKPAENRVAQGQRKQLTPEERAKRETDQMNQLTPLGDKYDKVLAVNTEFTTKRMALKSDARDQKMDQTKEAQDAKRAEMQAKMKELQTAHKKNLEEAMGKDLYDKYEAALKKQREERRAQRMQQNGGAAPAAAPAGK